MTFFCGSPFCHATMTYVRICWTEWDPGWDGIVTFPRIGSCVHRIPHELNHVIRPRVSSLDCLNQASVKFWNTYNERIYFLVCHNSFFAVRVILIKTSNNVGCCYNYRKLYRYIAVWNTTRYRFVLHWTSCRLRTCVYVPRLTIDILMRWLRMNLNRGASMVI